MDNKLSYSSFRVVLFECVVLYPFLCTFSHMIRIQKGSSGGSDNKESTCNVGDLGSTPGLGRSSGEGNHNPLQYSCLENSMDKRSWQATVHGVAKS